MKLYKSKAWLKEKYRTNTAEQIATLCGVTEKTITQYLHKYGIPIRRSR